MRRQTDLYNPPLQVVGFVGTKRGDEDRGPAISLNREEASLRLLADGELVFIHGPRRKELAPVIVDDEVPRGGVVVRDIDRSQSHSQPDCLGLVTGYSLAAIAHVPCGSH